MPEKQDSQEMSPKNPSYDTGATPLKSGVSYLALPVRALMDLVASINLGVHVKLLSGFLTGALLLLGMGIISLLVIERMSERVEELTLRQEVVDHARQMGHLVTAQSHFRAMALLTDDDTNNVKIANAKKEFLERLDAVEDSSGTEQGGFFAAVRETNDRYDVSSNRVLQFYLAGEIEEALKLHLDLEHEVSHELEDAMRVLVAVSNTEMAEAVAAFQSDRSLFRIMVAVFSGISLLLALLLGFVLSGSFVRPVRKIEQAVAAIAGGDFSQRVEVPNRDELGTLSKNVNGMSEQLSDLYEKLRQELAERERVEKTLEAEIDERRQAQTKLLEARDMALEATQAKSDFLASMSHEIRTPMNSIIGMAELLSNTPLNSEQQRYVQSFTKAGDALLTLIDDVLDLSKVEAGQLVLETVEFDLIDLIEDTAEYLAIRAHAKGLELTCSISGDVPMTLVGDPGRLRQVLTNLVGNAIKFTEEGEVTLRVETSPGVSKPGCLLVRVSDTGIGINPEQLDRIFDDFTQVDSSMTRKFEGTGLGLAISRRLVKMMEGRIWAESEIGHGSTFNFIVQLQPGGPSSRHVDAKWEDVKGLKTLIVDDNANNRLILQEMLAARGMTTNAVEDGYRALVELDQAVEDKDPYQLLLLDLRMPGMDGFQVAERIKDQFGVADITIMLLTSENRSENVARCRELGISRYLIKPVKQSELVQAILGAKGFDIPVGEAQPNEATSAAIQGPGSLRILLVEDAEDNRLLVQVHLDNAGHKTDLAENGEVAVEKFVSGQYDLVLMDMQMPVMDGYAATRAIREWEEGKGIGPTPILALTAHAFKEDVQLSLDAGCTAHITKPIKKKALMESIFEHAGHVADVTSQDNTGDRGKILVRVDSDIQRIVPVFLGHQREIIESILKALDEGEYDTVRILGHSMKGAGSGYGFDGISEFGQSMELAATDHNAEGIRKLVKELTTYLDRVEVIYE